MKSAREWIANSRIIVPSDADYINGTWIVRRALEGWENERRFERWERRMGQFQ